jgi:flagellar biosynthesis/type III secretory pathway protein FliH
MPHESFPDREVAISDRSRLALVLPGARVPRIAVAPLREAGALLQRANALLAQAREQADSLRERSRAEGYAAGLDQARAEAAVLLLDAQRGAREQLEASERRVAELACAIAARIAPRLAADAIVPDLVAQALRAAQAERYLLVRVHPQALAAVCAQAERWRAEYPAVSSLQVIADESLELLGCVVESESGSVQAGFAAQLEALRASLSAAARNARP